MLAQAAGASASRSGNAFDARHAATPGRPGLHRRVHSRSRPAVSTASQAAAESPAPAAEPIRLKAKRVTAESFKPFGKLVEPGEDGAMFGPDDAQLTLTNGIPRFYIMKLRSRGLQFDRITHHKKVTQCLAAADSNEWYLAVAKPSAHGPRVEDLAVFQVPPGVAVQLDMGTWHSGPYFENLAEMGFFNLELSDTNLTDHTTHVYKKEGLSFVIDKP